MNIYGLSYICIHISFAVQYLQNFHINIIFRIRTVKYPFTSNLFSIWDISSTWSFKDLCQLLIVFFKFVLKNDFATLHAYFVDNNEVTASVSCSHITNKSALDDYYVESTISMIAFSPAYTILALKISISLTLQPYPGKN